jgi:steroid 5-alpha reductase family enzyme
MSRFAIRGGALDTMQTPELERIENLQMDSIPSPVDELRETAATESHTKQGTQLVGNTESRTTASINGVLSTLAASRFLQEFRHVSLFPSMYMLCLAGSAIGFHLFVYFTTLGMALGIGIPSIVLWLQQPKLLHTLLVVLWSVRMLAFLSYREFYSWPALRQRSLDIKRTQSIPMKMQFTYWLVYSFFYTCMLSPCYYLLKQHKQQVITHGEINAVKFVNNPLALAFQISGLLLETVADYTKCRFKSLRKGEWCNVGVWKYGRHVNYAGEWLFWFGTFLAGMTRGKQSLVTVSALVMTIGLAFVSVMLYFAAEFVSARQLEKYGMEDEDDGEQNEYLKFREKYGLLGPNLRPVVQRVKAIILTRMQGSKMNAVSVTVTEERPEHVQDELIGTS